MGYHNHHTEVILNYFSSSSRQLNEKIEINIGGFCGLMELISHCSFQIKIFLYDTS